MELDKYLRKATAREDAEQEVLDLDVNGETFSFKKLADDDYDKIQTRIMEQTQGTGNETILDICRDLIYFSCPDLHEQELLDALGVIRPPDVVSKIFNPAEVSAIGASLMEFNGMTEVEAVKKI